RTTASNMAGEYVRIDSYCYGGNLKYNCDTFSRLDFTYEILLLRNLRKTNYGNRCRGRPSSKQETQRCLLRRLRRGRDDDGDASGLRGTSAEDSWQALVGQP